MKIRIASLLLALALPLAAQEPVAAETEAMFYKAFYLEKGQRDFAGAMSLYEQFLAKAPEHKLAAEAAKQQFRLLDATGKTKERDAFKAKYEKLLGNVATAPAAGGGGAAAGGADQPGRGEGRARGEGGPGAGRGDMQARMAEMEKQLEKAKADGNAEEVKRLEQQIERMKQGGGRGPGGGFGGGQGGQGGRGGFMSAFMGTKKVADMNDEELKQLKDGLGQAGQMVERMRERSPEQADKVEKGIADLKKALDANNKEDAQKALDALREAMPRRGRGGEGGGPGGGGGGRGGNGGGGGGGNGGGGGGR